MKNKRAEFQKMISGKLYNCTDRYIILKHARALILADRFNRTHIWNLPYRDHLLKRLIPNHGKKFFILNNLRVEYGCNITFGDDFFANFDCTMLDVAPIKIGNSVMFGARVTIATPMHPLLAQERIIQQYPSGYHDLEYAKPVTIGDGVWIASNVTICGGVTIGNNTIVAAGSVVTRDLPDNSLCAGVPCKVLRKLDEDDRINVWDTYCKEELPLSVRAKSKLNDSVSNG